MENGTLASAIAEDRRANSSNAVATIFSKKSRTEAEWGDLAEDLFKCIHGWNRAFPCILDQDEAKSGRVYEVHAASPGTANTFEVHLDFCAALRRSQGVQAIEETWDVEIIIQPAKLYRKHQTPGLAVFDMDSTLIQQEVIDELARSVGRYDEVAAVTEAAMRGELNFEESLKARVAKLDGVSTGIWEHMKANVITFTPGAAELVKALKHLGWKTAVLSGGFTPLAYWVKDTLGLDYAYANQLATDSTGSKLTGELVSGTPIVGPNLKRDTLLRLAVENDIPISDTIAVGDGSNDLPMMQVAGLGIAFNAKPKVQAAAPARLNSKSLVDILYVLGFNFDEISKLS